MNTCLFTSLPLPEDGNITLYSKAYSIASEIYYCVTA